MVESLPSTLRSSWIISITGASGTAIGLGVQAVEKGDKLTNARDPRGGPHSVSIQNAALFCAPAPVHPPWFWPAQRRDLELQQRPLGCEHPRNPSHAR